MHLRLRTGGTLRIRVERGLPGWQGRHYVPPGALLDAAGRDWTRVVDPELSPDGREAVFGPLPPGTWTVLATGGPERVRVTADRETVVELTGENGFRPPGIQLPEPTAAD
jgi:hypothetical protein